MTESCFRIPERSPKVYCFNITCPDRRRCGADANISRVLGPHT